jgi:hypothetical protein
MRTARKARTEKQVRAHRSDTQRYRDKARARGGLVVYAMIESPEAVEAWHAMREIFANNRDLVENALITAYEELKDNK